VSSGKFFKVKFYVSDISVPFGVEVIDISPKETAIELDRNVMMEIPIKVLYIGDGPGDRKIKEVIIEPRNLMISGPIEILKSISRLETAPVNQALFNKDEGSITVPLGELDPRLKFEENPKIKLKYKTQVLNLKRVMKKD
jgi:YbbR domain-containing protein